MSIAATTARILLGIIFTAAGAFTFFVTNAPPLPGVAGEFNHALYASHYAQFIGVAQIAIGVLFSINRYVPVALIMLAAFLYNRFAFHLTMMPAGLFGPILVLILATPVALTRRSAFVPVFHGRESRTLRSDACP
jgi:uncharacterized membrane protein YphA (DoxX/SURF4 family)